MRTAIMVVLLALALAGASSGWAQEECEDDVYATVEGSTIRIVHAGATYNCCPTFAYEVEQDGDLITVREIEVEELCDCICCMDLSVDVEDVAPGDYTVLFFWLEYDVWEWYVWELFVTVPDAGQIGPAPVIAAFTHSDCYGSTPVRGTEPGQTWSMIKTLYR